MQRVFKSGHKSSFGRWSAGRSRCISPDELTAQCGNSKPDRKQCVCVLACPFLASSYPGATLDRLPLRSCHVLLHPGTFGPRDKGGENKMETLLPGLCCVATHPTIMPEVGFVGVPRPLTSWRAIERPIGSLRSAIRRSKERKPRLGRSTATILRCKEENWGRSPVPENSGMRQIEHRRSGKWGPPNPVCGVFYPSSSFPSRCLADNLFFAQCTKPQGETISAQRGSTVVVLFRLHNRSM